MRRLVPMAGVLALVAVLAVGLFVARGAGGGWTEEERGRIASLSLSSLPPLPPDPSNAVADDPAAAALGKALFFDTRLSGNGRVACATCHVPDRQFQDGTPLAHGIGTTTRRTMPVAGTAYSPWMFWDGRADSQWAQALGPLENRNEHGTSRAAVVQILSAHYAADYSAVFGRAPDAEPVDRAFSNAGKAIAAFERTLLPPHTRFDDYADAVAGGQPSQALSEQEVDGLRLFIGKANCLNCHNGPLLTDQSFHNTGVPSVPGLPEDTGRATAVAIVQNNPFNCLGAFSDAQPGECAELTYMKTTGEDLVRAYKAPSLRGVAQRAPFMHAGQFASLEQAVAHYNAAPAAPAGHTELVPLGLTADERAALVAFLRTLQP